MNILKRIKEKWTVVDYLMYAGIVGLLVYIGFFK